MISRIRIFIYIYVGVCACICMHVYTSTHIYIDFRVSLKFPLRFMDGIYAEKRHALEAVRRRIFILAGSASLGDVTCDACLTSSGAFGICIM